jgi:hypothetical protein
MTIISFCVLLKGGETAKCFLKMPIYIPSKSINFVYNIEHVKIILTL